MKQIKFILWIASRLWMWRNENYNSQFIMVLLRFIKKSPLARHAYDYLTWLSTSESQSIERKDGKIIITFYGDF